MNRSLCLSYLRLSLLVSPRSQQQLHSCGVTIARGIHKSSAALLLYIEGEGGTHHSSKNREKEDENMRDMRSGRVDMSRWQTHVSVCEELDGHM